VQGFADLAGAVNAAEDWAVADAHSQRRTSSAAKRGR
jgi:hypothetical protein